MSEPNIADRKVQRERLYQAWDDGADAVLRDAAAVSRLHRRLWQQQAARVELTDFDLWVFPMLYGQTNSA